MRGLEGPYGMFHWGVFGALSDQRELINGGSQAVKTPDFNRHRWDLKAVAMVL